MNKVREQYEKWVYPAPRRDLAQDAAEGYYDLSDPSLFRRKLWPRAVEPLRLKILVAGCGSTQAAALAHHNRDHQIVGVDISQASLDHSEHLKRQHDLTNLQLHRLGIHELDRLGQRFDLILSTGVLHHLPDPDAGLRQLKKALEPHGVMSIMVYAWHRRFGAYMLQEAFRALGVEQTDAGVALVRETVGALPAWHHLRSFLPKAQAAQASDAEIVDIFLHPCDRAYTVPQVLRFATDNGLRFQDWLDRHDYSATAHIDAKLALHASVLKLPREEQWQMVELIGQLIECHRFLLCHAERDSADHVVEFASPEEEAWLSLTPHLRWPIDLLQGPDAWLSYGPRLRPPVESEARRDPRFGVPATFRRLAKVFHLDEREAPLFRMVDGRTTIGRIIDACTSIPDIRRTAFGLFSRMRDWDHLVYEIS